MKLNQMHRMPLFATALFLASAALLHFDLMPIYAAWLVLAMGLLLFAGGAWSLTKRR
jgi:hypothetical protein